MATATVAVDLVDFNPLNPRRFRAERDAEAIGELAASIDRQGLLAPLIVTYREPRYRLIAGERRLRAIRQLGWRFVPVVIRDVDDDRALELSLLENIQREDVDPWEQAISFRMMIDNLGYSQERIAQAIGKAPSYVSGALSSWAFVSAVAPDIDIGGLSRSHAEALAQARLEADLKRDLLREVLDRGLTVRQTEELVRAHVRRRRQIAGPEGAALLAAAGSRAQDDALHEHPARVSVRSLQTYRAIKAAEDHGDLTVDKGVLIAALEHDLALLRPGS
jgi:ParB family chromosome partitioning protein